ncbi:MAG: hypothetical protein KC609_15565 [Myxococcales bacterium]|nr:hypothetical protein [Myxococcales bacterium]
MPDLLAKIEHVTIVRVGENAARSASWWTVETEGLARDFRWDLMVSSVPTALCQPIAEILRQMAEFVLRGNPFYPDDELDLGLARIVLQRGKERVLELKDAATGDEGSKSSSESGESAESSSTKPAVDYPSSTNAATLFAKLADDAGWHYFRHDAFEEAIELFSLALEYRPTLVTSASGSGFAKARLGDVVAAAEQIERAAAFAQKQKHEELPTLLFQAGLLRHELALIAEGAADRDELRHQIKAAIEFYDRSEKWEPSALLCFQRARSHKLRGDETAVERDVQRMHELEPDLSAPALRMALSELYRQADTFRLTPLDFQGHSLRQILEEVSESIAERY